MQKKTINRNHRILICFLKNTQIRISLDKLFRSAATQHLEPVSWHIAAFLQYDTFFLMNKGKINIYVHVPLYDKNKILYLLQFNNAPTQISDSVALKLSPPGNILAMGQDGIHTTMTPEELLSIKKYGNMFFSDTALTLNLPPNSSCLGKIYSQDYNNIKVICTTKFWETTEQFTNITPGEYIFYTRLLKLSKLDAHQVPTT